jgi:hypothetical protein
VRSRSRARFHWTDPLWWASGLIWIVTAFVVSWPEAAALLALSSISIGTLGFAIDSRTHRRLPWWAKGAIPLVTGFGLAWLLSATGAGVLVVLVLLISIGVAVLLLRRPGR